MALKYTIATLAILLGQRQSLVAQTHTAPMLEIRVDSPNWVNGCLDLTIERVNVSSQTIYIPDWEGIVFFLSTKLIYNEPSGKDSELWLPFYGLSDIVTYDAHQLAAGSKTTDHFCLPETFAVVNEREKTRRQTAVRGHVRIVASYFPTEEDWKTNKAEQEKHWPTLWRSPSVSLEMPLPCTSKPDCISDCQTPPPIRVGESVAIPDIFKFYKDWNDRGKTLADTLNREYPICKH